MVRRCFACVRVISAKSFRRSLAAMRATFVAEVTFGLDVYNGSKQDIGTIKDIAYAGPNVNAYIVAVGGFLGVGDHYVAVNPSDISVTWDAGAKKWHASMNTTADQLKAAPEFKYSTKS